MFAYCIQGSIVPAIPAQLDNGNVLVTTNALMPIGSAMDITIVAITLTRIPYTAAASQVNSPVPTSSVFHSGIVTTLLELCFYIEVSHLILRMRCCSSNCPFNINL